MTKLARDRLEFRRVGELAEDREPAVLIVKGLEELFARLKKNWLVAPFGSPPTLAIARVPNRVEVSNSSVS